MSDAKPYGFMDTSLKAAGELEGIRQLVERFYTYMDSEPQAASLRDMHAQDLTQAKQRLTDFLCGWMGGPKRYQENYGSIQIPGFHRQFDITQKEAEAWYDCMCLAIDDQDYEPAFVGYLKKQLRFPIEMIVKAQRQ